MAEHVILILLYFYWENSTNGSSYVPDSSLLCRFHSLFFFLLHSTPSTLYHVSAREYRCSLKPSSNNALAGATTPIHFSHFRTVYTELFCLLQYFTECPLLAEFGCFLFCVFFSG